MLENFFRANASLFEVVNLFVGIVSIALAVAAIWYARKQSRDAEATLAQLSTRYVGKFPLNINDVVEIIRSAKSDILILTDFAGYCSYSSYALFKKYIMEIEAAKEAGVTVRLVIYGQELRREIFKKQFTPSYLKKMQRRGPRSGKNKFTEFLERMDSRVKVINYESFLEALMLDEMDWHQRLKQVLQSKCYELSQIAPIFLWMVDGTECVFSFENEPDKRTFCFRTRDGQLLEFFAQYVKGLIDGPGRVPPRKSEDGMETMPSD